MRKSFLWIIINLLIFFAPPFMSGTRAENRMVAQPSCFTGVVKWFDQQNGYGLITPLNGGADVFAHFSTITTSDNNAQKVLFPGQVVDFGMVYDDSMGRNRTTWVVPKQIYQ